jgi:hypothetical protein
VHLVSGKTRSWMCDIKMNSNVRSMNFLDDNSLVTGGSSSDVYLWDLRLSGKCLAKWVIEWVSEWRVCEWVSEREWVSEWARVSEWVSVSEWVWEVLSYNLD